MGTDNLNYFYMPGMKNNVYNDITLPMSIFVGKLCDDKTLCITQSNQTEDHMFFFLGLSECPSENEFDVMISKEVGSFNDRVNGYFLEHDQQIAGSFYNKNEVEELKQDVILFLRSGIHHGISHN